MKDYSSVDTQIKIKYLEKYNKYAVGDFSSLDSKAWIEARTATSGARCDLVKLYSWAIPNTEALETIAKYSPIVEMGAGTGYWKFLLEKYYDVDIIAYDMKPYRNIYCKKSWSRVIKGKPYVLKHHQDRTLLLIWPPYNNQMAYQSLKHWKGEYLIYIGESDGGCTGDADFHKLLSNEFNELESVDISQWVGCHDILTVYKRG